MADSTQDSPFLLDMDAHELKAMLDSWSEPGYRVSQIWEGIYKQLWQKPSEFSSLPMQLRGRLEKSVIFSKLCPVKTLSSIDGNTTKVLFSLEDQKNIETVLMRYERRNTICVSTQVGCAMNCSFCATGHMGFSRDLSSGEIIEQILFFDRTLKNAGQKVTNLVFMGMGEPFLNYSLVMSDIDRLINSQGFNLGERRMTISTVGLIPMIERFTREKRQVNLAISLHAANDETRLKLLPINKKYPLAPLMQACRNYVEYTGRRVSFEWALINEINDRVEDARQLSGLLKGWLAHVNLIPLNHTENYPGKGSNKKRLNDFCQELDNQNISYTVRLRRGTDIKAGCGQLATQFVNRI